MSEHRSYSRTGLNALKTRVAVRGLQAIDRRTSAARALLDWRRELLADLGGEQAVSASQRALVDLVVRTRLYVDHLDAWLVGQRSLVNARRRSVLPVLRERQQLADSLVRQLHALGTSGPRASQPLPVEQLHAMLEAAEAEGAQRLSAGADPPASGSNGAHQGPPQG